MHCSFVPRCGETWCWMWRRSGVVGAGAEYEGIEPLDTTLDRHPGTSWTTLNNEAPIHSLQLRYDGQLIAVKQNQRRRQDLDLEEWRGQGCLSGLQQAIPEPPYASDQFCTAMNEDCE